MMKSRKEKDVLPALNTNEKLNLLNISSKESFTRPPSRYY